MTLEDGASDLRRAADELYAAPLSDFTGARNAMAAAIADKALARRVRALPKPTLGAWAVNALVRRRPDEVGQALELGEALRSAAESMQGEEVRTLTRQRRRLTAALASSAGQLAAQQGMRLTRAVLDQVEGVLNAAMLDADAARAVRTGLLLRPFTATGLAGEQDLDGLVAVPAVLGTSATPVTGTGPQPRLRVVPEDDRLRRERAEDAVASARTGLDRARDDRAAIAQERQELAARGLQVAEEVDEVRRRLAELESAAEEIEEAREELDTRVAEADGQVEAAEQELAEAQRRLDDLA